MTFCLLVQLKVQLGEGDDVNAINDLYFIVTRSLRLSGDSSLRLRVGLDLGALNEAIFAREM